MEILKRHELILMHSLHYIFILIRLLLYHMCEVPWAHTQEIIVKDNSGEIRLFQVGTVHIMKGFK